MGEYSVVGKRLPRIDALEKVTGGAIFGADVNLPGMLYGKILRSPYAHASILSIDTSGAEQLPGVKAVVTAADVPEGGGRIFARDKVRHQGEAIVAVAAVDEDTAEDALGLIEVEYEELPSVFDPMEAMKPDAPEIHESKHGRMKNITGQASFSRGDVERGFKESDFVFEDTFSIGPAHQGYIEPHVATASVDPSGRVTVWTSTQGLFGVRSGLAQTLNIPVSRIRVVPTVMGGGFGGKLGISVEPVCTLLARKAGRPVKVSMTREEEFLASNAGPRCIARVKTGVKKDGTLIARQVEAYWDSGAYGGSPAGSSVRILGPYRISNIKVEGYGIYTNKLRTGAYRAPATPQATFVGESQIETIAHKLGIDPLEMRLKNAIVEGDPDPNGNPYPAIGLRETLEEAKKAVDWGRWEKGENQGRGVACGQWGSGQGPSSAYVTVNEDGTVVLTVGSMDITGSHTSMGQIVAEVMGVSLGDVIVTTADTDTAPYAASSAGSRITYSMGTVCRRAAEDARRRVFEIAAEELGTKPDEMEAVEGHIRSRKDHNLSMSLAEVAMASLSSRWGPVVGRASLTRVGNDPTFATVVADVEVDTETGQVRLLRLVCSQDVGFAINPASVEGQIEGGVAQAIGMGLMEEFIYGEGRMLNPNFLDYRIPTSLDVPKVESVLVEKRSASGPFGAKGAGEPPITAPAAAIANAIYDAVGVRVKDAPITPEKILKALKEKMGGR